MRVRPLGVGGQAKVPNRLKLCWLEKVRVVNVKEKAWRITSGKYQGDERK